MSARLDRVFWRLALLLMAAEIHCLLAQGDHNDGPHCDTDSIPKITAPYVPGTITIDGNARDWGSVSGQSFKLVQAVGPPEQYSQGSGSMLIKAAHDGQNLYVLLQAPGDFVWSAETPHLGPSVSIMFGIGDNATFYKMGGCPAYPSSCSEEVCRGFEVDLMQFELSTAVPGRLYGGNLADTLQASGHDSIGHLNDMFGWSPHCKHYDSPPASSGLNSSSPLWAASGAQNDWHGAWSHTSISSDVGLIMLAAPFGKLGEPGEFVFEFTRPLRTHDRFQQDVQLTIGSSHRFGAALWYPLNSAPWVDSQHFVTSCDWVALHLLYAPQPSSGWAKDVAGEGSTAAVLAALALLLSLAAIAVVMVVWWWVRTNTRQFTPMDGL